MRDTDQPRRRRLGAPLQDWGNVLLLGLAVWVLATLVAFHLGRDRLDAGAWLQDLPYPVLSLAAAGFAWRAARHGVLDRASRRAWTLLGFAFALFGLGDALWVYYDFVLGIDPFPSWADVAYLSFYPLMLWGLLTFPLAAGSRTGNVAFWLDAGTVLLGGWMVVWYFILGPAAQVTDAGLIDTVLAVAYPVGDVVLLFGAAAVLLGRWDPDHYPAPGMLAAGVLLFIAADLSFGYLSLQETYQWGGLPDQLWLVALFLFALSGHYQYRRSGQAVAGQALQAAPPRSVWLLPYAAVGISYGLLLVMAEREATNPLKGMVYAAVAMTGLVVARLVATARENARLVAQHTARESEARFRSLVQNSSDVIVVIAADWTITYVSPAVERVLGYGSGDLVGTRLDTALHNREAPWARTVLQEVLEQPGVTRLVEWQFVRRDGSVCHTETILNNLLADPGVHGVVLNIWDMTERKVLEARIQHQACHDPLTGLGNRTLLKEQIDLALREQRGAAGTVAVLFLDLDGFKTINDSLGHHVGDQLLIALAERLRQCVGPGATVTRLGGDEFAVVLSGTRVEAATAVAHHILDRVRMPFLFEGREVSIGASLGVATNAAGSEGAAELLRNADLAMYRAKAEGSGHCAVYDPSMYREMLERLDLEVDLRQAVERQEFILYYQPAVDLATGRMVGVEALVRWQHPQRGLVLPGHFIPFAEEKELIVPIGAWVLQEACGQLRCWQEQFGEHAPATMAVNLSVRQLDTPDLVAQVERCLGAYGLAPHSLIMEITESSLLRGSRSLIGSLQQLRDLGVRLAIDDFGAGFSSFNYLRWFPADILKIDRSFVREVTSSPRGVSLIKGIVNLAHALGLQTVAEGIEQAEEVAQLRALSCAVGQGYYFAPPRAPKEVEAFFLAPVGDRIARAERCSASSFISNDRKADGAP